MENSLFKSVYNPDVLSCIANLSNDEVFTPPELANKIIDMLPKELFENPDTTFFDPCCKSGATSLQMNVCDQTPVSWNRLVVMAISWLLYSNVNLPNCAGNTKRAHATMKNKPLSLLVASTV